CLSLFESLRHSISTLFPYTTLFRSGGGMDAALGQQPLPAQELEDARRALRVVQPPRHGGAALRRPDDVEAGATEGADQGAQPARDRKSTRLNSSHVKISYAVFCLKK